MNVCFIYNPESGSGKIISYLDWIKEEFLRYNHAITLYETKKEKDAYYKVLESNEYDMFLIAGGDGTVNEVVNALMQLETRPIIAYIPTGTVNDVGHLIGMPLRIKRAVKMILEKPYVKDVDICQINDKYFVYVAAAGKFTKSSYDIKRKYKKRYGRLAYFFRGSREIFKDYKIPIKVTHEGETFEELCSLILALNGRRIGGFHLYGMKNKLDDGQVSLRFFRRESWLLLRVIAFFLTGGLYDTGKNKTFRSSSFKIETDDNVSWNVDGEYMGQGSIEIDVVPKAVKFIVNERKARKNFTKTKKKNKK